MDLLLDINQEKQLKNLATVAKGSYIFYGSTGVGKFSSAVWLAKRLNCLGDEQGDCSHCLAIASGNYPDLIVVTPDEKSIGIGQVQQLQAALSLSQYSSAARRVVIIDAADTLTSEAQNCLLKTLEEPPSATLIFLIARETDNLLATVRSRCAQLFFPLLPAAKIAQYLTTHKALPNAQSSALAELANGSIGAAITLTDSPEQLKSFQQAGDLAVKVLQVRRFDRLLIAAQLAESPTSVDGFIQALIVKVRASIRASIASTPTLTGQLANQLVALERFHNYRSANVNLKAALEGLMLEL